MWERMNELASQNLAVLVVLGTVARAHELVGGLVPGNDAAQMGAHSVHAYKQQLCQQDSSLGDDIRIDSFH